MEAQLTKSNILFKKNKKGKTQRNEGKFTRNFWKSKGEICEGNLTALTNTFVTTEGHKY